MFIDVLGFDDLDAGELAADKNYEPGIDVFNGRFSTQELSVKLLGNLISAYGT